MACIAWPVYKCRMFPPEMMSLAAQAHVVVACLYLSATSSRLQHLHNARSDEHRRMSKTRVK